MITQERLKQLYHYNELSGLFTHLGTGKVAGCYNKVYATIGIDYGTYSVHQLAFLYMTGKIPKCIDHIDRDKHNNAWHNLREATFSENLHNVGTTSRNSTGVKGVSFDSKRRKYCAQICVNGSRKFLGRFSSLQDAENALLEYRHD